MAKLGQQRLLLSDFHAVMHEVPVAERRDVAFDERLLTRLVEATLQNKALAERAREMGIDVPYLEQRKALLESRLLAQAYVQHMRESIVVPDMESAARERFMANRSQYRVPRTAQIRYIAISTRNRSETEASSLAVELADRASAGEDFEKLVATYSDEPDDGLRGLLDAYELIDPPPPDDPLSRSLQGIEPGGLGIPFKQRDIFFVPKLIAFNEGRDMEFEEVKDQIVAQLTAEYTSRELARIVGTDSMPPLEWLSDDLPALRDFYLTPQSR